MAAQKAVEITEAFIKSLHSCSCMPDVKREIETHFPQLFLQEVELEPGLYLDKEGMPYILCKDKEGDWRLSNKNGFVEQSYFSRHRSPDLDELRQIMAGLRRVE